MVYVRVGGCVCVRDTDRLGSWRLRAVVCVCVCMTHRQTGVLETKSSGVCVCDTQTDWGPGDEVQWCMCVWVGVCV